MRGRSKRVNAGHHRGKSPQASSKKKIKSNKSQIGASDASLISHGHIRSSDQSFSVEYSHENDNYLDANFLNPIHDNFTANLPNTMLEADTCRPSIITCGHQNTFALGNSQSVINNFAQDHNFAFCRADHCAWSNSTAQMPIYSICHSATNQSINSNYARSHAANYSISPSIASVSNVACQNTFLGDRFATTTTNRPLSSSIASLSHASPSVLANSFLSNIPIKDFNLQSGTGNQIQYIPVLVNQPSQVSGTPQAAQPVPIHSTFGIGAQPGETIHVYVNHDTQEKVFGNWAIPMASLLEEDPTLGSNKDQPKKPKIPVKDKVLTLEQFTMAFTRFSSLLVSRYCHLAPGLLTHLHQVHQVARDGGDWASFDMQVRKHIQYGFRKWGDKCSEFAVQAVQTGIRDLIQGQPISDSKSSENADEKVPRGYCFSFHKNGSCDKRKQKCKGNFKHLCYHCEEDHRAVDCTKPQTERAVFSQKSDKSFGFRKN